MGAKTQLENKKLDVPAPGAYNIPDKVSKTFGRNPRVQLVESQGKTMGEKTKIKQLQGVLGPGPGGYDGNKLKS